MPIDRTSGWRNQQGFGLLEVLLVVAIIAVLIITSSRFIRAQSAPDIQAKQFQSYLFAVEHAAQTYFQQNCPVFVKYKQGATLNDLNSLFTNLGEIPPTPPPGLKFTTTINYIVHDNGYDPTYIIIAIDMTFSEPIPTGGTLSIFANTTQGRVMNPTTLEWILMGNMDLKATTIDPWTEARLQYKEIRDANAVCRPAL